LTTTIVAKHKKQGDMGSQMKPNIDHELTQGWGNWFIDPASNDESTPSGEIAGLPVFCDTEFPDGWIGMGDREVVRHLLQHAQQLVNVEVRN